MISNDVRDDRLEGLTPPDHPHPVLDHTDKDQKVPASCQNPKVSGSGGGFRDHLFWVLEKSPTLPPVRTNAEKSPTGQREAKGNSGNQEGE